MNLTLLQNLFQFRLILGRAHCWGLNCARRLISIASCLLALQVLSTGPAFADVTVELTRVTPNGNGKVIRYLTPKKLRIDVVEKEKTTITLIDPVSALICTRPNKTAATGLCQSFSLEVLKAIIANIYSKKGVAKITHYRTTPTGEHGNFVGRRCDYFKRSKTIDIGDVNPGSTTEIFCADRSLAKEMMGLPEDVFISPLIASIADKKLRQQALLSEKKALGLHIFSESWVHPNSNLLYDIDLKKDPQLPPDKDSEKQLRELDVLYKKMQTESKKPKKTESNVGIKVVVGPISPSVFRIPPPLYEVVKKK